MEEEMGEMCSKPAERYFSVQLLFYRPRSGFSFKLRFSMLSHNTYCKIYFNFILFLFLEGDENYKEKCVW